FFQLQAYSRKLSLTEKTVGGIATTQCSELNREAIDLIQFINDGGKLNVEEVGWDMLKEVFALLWRKDLQFRIDHKFKNIYFELKARYFRLNKANQGKSGKCKLAA